MLRHAIIGRQALVILVVRVVFLRCFEAGAELSLPSHVPHDAQPRTGLQHSRVLSRAQEGATRPWLAFLGSGPHGP